MTNMLPVRAVAVITAGLLMLTPAVARDLTADESASLHTAVVAFEEASRANDKAAALDMMTGGLLGFYKELYPDLDEAGMRKMLLDQPPMVDNDDHPTSPDYSLNDMHEERALPPAELRDGTVYVVMPASTVVYQMNGQGGGDYEVQTQPLIALLENGAWKFLVMTAPRETGLHAKIIPAVDGDDAFFAALDAVVK